MATKKFFDVITTGKTYDKFLGPDYMIKVHRIEGNRFYFAFNNKGIELAYTIQPCKNYAQIEKEAREFLAWLKDVPDFTEILKNF